MNKIRLNKRNIEKLVFPEKDSIFYHDDQLQGLAIRATETGSLIWTLVKRINKRPAKIRLGPYPDLSPDDARRMCLEKLGQIARGEDPRAAQQPDGLTFGQLFTQYLDEHAKVHKKSWEDDQATYERSLKPFAGKLLGEFDRKVVRRIHLRMRETPVSANRVLALISKVFAFAMDEAEVFPGPNPARGVKRYREKSRTRYLTLQEIPRFYDALRKETPFFRDFFLICIYTGARKSDVRHMRAEQLDLDQRTWTIPDPKNGEVTVIHLPTAAVEILRTRPQSGWIWPSPSHLVNSGPLRDPKAAWERIRKRSGITDLNMHDLRRSLGSWQAAQGASLSIIGKSLGHKSLSSTEIYSRLCLDPVRDSVDSALEAFEAIRSLADAQSETSSDQHDRDE